MSVPEIFTLSASLREFFPPDHENVEWLYRLAVLRDDLAYEAENIALKANEPLDAVWRCGYFLRKFAVTVHEIRNVFCYDVTKLLKKRKDRLPPPFVAMFKESIDAVEEIARFTQTIRDEVGGHVRPKNLRPLIKAHADTPMEVRLDMHTGKSTSLRNMTVSAFIFAWPDVLTNEDFLHKHDEFLKLLARAFPATVHGIDTLLYMQWAEAGLEAHPC